VPNVFPFDCPVITPLNVALVAAIEDENVAAPVEAIINHYLLKYYLLY